MFSPNIEQVAFSEADMGWEIPKIEKWGESLPYFKNTLHMLHIENHESRKSSH